MDEQISLFDLGSASGRTSPALSPATEAATSRRFSRSSSGSPNPKLPMCLCLTRGGWTKSGCLYDEMGKWSVAWRVHDAQHWGVPQRRKRICVLADFGGLAAPEILFDPQLRRTTEDGEPIAPDRYSGTECGPEVQTQPESLSGDSSESGAPRKGTAGSAVCSLADSVTGSGQGGAIPIDTMNGLGRPTEHTLGVGNPGDPCYTLSKGHSHAVCYGIIADQTLLRPKGFDRYNGQLTGDVSQTLNACAGTSRDNTPMVFEQKAFGISSDKSHAMLSDNPHAGIYEADTARTLDLNGGSPACNQGGIAIVSIPEIVNTIPARMDGSPCIDRGPPFIAVYDARGRGDGKVVPTMAGDHFGHISDYTALCVGNGQLNQMSMEQVSNTLDAMHDPQAVLIAYSPEVAHGLKAKANLQFREDSETYIVAAVDCRNGTANPDVNGTLQAKEQGQNLNSNNVVLIWPEVRRLTPLECTRLQGFPDGWLDIGDWTDESGKLHREADAPKYKAAGNSIALPFWSWLARRICAEYERPITMGSLFSGIGGFELAFKLCGAQPVWNSEIEPYPIAVTKRHFGDGEEEGDIAEFM